MSKIHGLITACASLSLWTAALSLAACTGLPEGGRDTNRYTVQTNDSLAGIAEAYGVSMQAVIDANQARYPGIAQPSSTNRLQAGWELVIPRSTVHPALQGAPSAATETSPAAGEAWDFQAADEIVQLTNVERAGAGLPPLTVDAGLAELARLRAVDIVTDYSHAGLRERCGGCGENINQAAGSQAAQRLMAGWMNSAAHRANILLPDVARIGVGVYVVDGWHYAVQLFDY